MNKFILWLSLLLIPPHLKAQDVYYSAYDKFNINEDECAVIGKINSLIYTYRSDGKDHFLDAFDDNMNKKATVILDFFPQKIYGVHFVAKGNSMIVLYQSLLNTTLIQYAALLDEKGMLKKSPIKLDEQRTGILGPTKNYYSFSHTADKSKVLCYKITNGRKKINFEGFWIDEELNLIKKISTDYHNDHQLEATIADIANDGAIYLSAMANEGSKNFSSHYALLHMPFAEKKFTASTFPLNEKYMTDHYIKLDEVNKKIYLGGFYSSSKSGNFEGVIYAEQQMGEPTWTQQFYPFSEQLKEQTGARNIKKAFNDYNVKHLIIKNDGGFVMVAEQHFINLRTDYRNNFGYYSFYYTPMGGRTIREYYYGDILALSYNAQGLNEWHSFIPKNQISFEDGGLFSAYGLINTGGALGFLYNDFNNRRSSVHYSLLQSDGQLNNKSLGNMGTEDPDWIPRMGKQVSANEMIVPCLSRKKLCFARVTF